MRGELSLDNLSSIWLDIEDGCLVVFFKQSRPYLAKDGLKIYTNLGIENIRLSQECFDFQLEKHAKTQAHIAEKAAEILLEKRHRHD